MSTLEVRRDLVQRTDEWLQARAGIITASVVGRLLSVAAPGASAYDCPECNAPAEIPCVSLRGGAPIKTTHSGRTTLAAAHADTAPPVIVPADGDTARRVILNLAAERITGHVEDGHMTADMWRGVEDEPFAVDAYERAYAPVDTGVGIMIRDWGDYRLGYSPDGLVGDDGLIEIKSRLQQRQVSTVIDGEVPAENYAQLQAALIVSGREWIDYVSFSGGMVLWVKRVEPDPQWLDAIHTAAERAEAAITETVQRFEKAATGLPMTERVNRDLEMRI